jgi:hypothetical protein
MQFIGFRSVIGTQTMWAVDESGRLDHTLAAFNQRIVYIHLGA